MIASANVFEFTADGFIFFFTFNNFFKDSLNINFSICNHFKKKSEYKLSTLINKYI